MINLPPITWPDPSRIDPDLWELFTDSVMIEPFIEKDAYQTASYGPPVRYPSRNTGGTQLARSLEGQNVIATGRIHVLALATIRAEDRLTLVDEDMARPPIIQVDRHTDNVGLYFQTLYTGASVFRQSSSG